MAESDARTSLKHILADDQPIESTKPSTTTSPHLSSHTAQASVKDDEEGAVSKPSINAQEVEAPKFTPATQSIRRNANGSVSSVFSGNKIRHLKKDDGIPLWRKDIQFEFLQLIFGDTRDVFTCFSDKTKGHTFSQIYIDAMIKSSKTSKILKEKLATEHTPAVQMAMVCLLVNVGRMNTTLNFFPEMRAQLRTFHSIPALQAHQETNAYKQLQDAPRLKSILKGASEDDPQPGSIEEVRKASVPRTTPVNLIFVLSQYAPKVSELHFTPPIDFFDLVMKPTLSSKSRANAFLWLLWWYLESDFSLKACRENPFGPGQETEGADGKISIKVPNLETLTEEEATAENIDPDDELEYGEAKRRERLAILASDPSPAMTALKRARKDNPHEHRTDLASDDEAHSRPWADHGSPRTTAYMNDERSVNSDDMARSPSPDHRARHTLTKADSYDDYDMMRSDVLTDPNTTERMHLGTNKLRLSRRSAPLYELDPTVQNHNTPSSRSVAFVDDSIAGNKRRSMGRVFAEPEEKRVRRISAYQTNMPEGRRNRVQRVLNSEISVQRAESRHEREKEGVLLRAWQRIKQLPSGWDSEEEELRVAKDENDSATNADGSAKTASETVKTLSKGDTKADGTSSKKDASKEVRVQRPAGGVWMAGFVLPDMADTLDCGEGYRYYGRSFLRAARIFQQAEMNSSEALTASQTLGVRADESDFDDRYVIGERPDGQGYDLAGKKRRVTAGATGSKSGRGVTKKAAPKRKSGAGTQGLVGAALASKMKSTANRIKLLRRSTEAVSEVTAGDGVSNEVENLPDKGYDRDAETADQEMLGGIEDDEGEEDLTVVDNGDRRETIDVDERAGQISGQEGISGEVVMGEA